MDLPTIKVARTRATEILLATGWTWSAQGYEWSRGDGIADRGVLSFEMDATDTFVSAVKLAHRPQGQNTDGTNRHIPQTPVVRFDGR
jgi:hypothetical protein